MFSTHTLASLSRRRAGAVSALLVALAAGLGSLLATTGGANAGLSWCADDPLIYIDGHLVDVNAQAPLEQLGNISGDVVFTVHAPKGSTVKVVLETSVWFPVRTVVLKDQPAWNGKTKLTVPIEIDVTPKSGSFPIRGTALDDNLHYAIHEGAAGTTLKFKAVVRDSVLNRTLNALW